MKANSASVRPPDAEENMGLEAMPRLAYFPEIYADEMLYSVLARYVRHTASPWLEATRTLFRLRYYALSPWLPSKLDVLAASLDRSLGIDADRLIDETTFFAYFAAFQRAEKRGQLRSMMKKNGQPSVSAGALLSLPKPPRFLRFCPECDERSMSSIGERYWRRAHQLPGVLVCSEHLNPLRASSAMPVVLNRPCPVAATAATCDPDVPALIAPDHALFQQAVQFAAASQSLLGCRGGRDRGQSSARYRQQLLELGYVNPEGKIDSHAVAEAFDRDLGDFAELVGLPPVVAPESWLVFLLRPSNRATGPASHLLMDGFLDHAAPWGELAAARSMVGPGPFPCLNPLVGHAGESPVTEWSVRERGGKRLPRFEATFRCGCGYVYSRGVDPGQPLGRPIVKSVGPSFRPAMQRLAALKVTLAVAARELGLYQNTLLAQARMLGVTHSWHRRIGRFPNRPNPPESVARQRDSLKKWKRTPVLKRSPDDELAAKVRLVAAEILEVSPLVRVTRAEIIRRLSNPSWLLVLNKERVEIVEALASAVETREAWLRRRVQRAIERLVSRGEPLTAYRVRREAGINSEFGDIVRAQLE